MSKENEVEASNWAPDRIWLQREAGVDFEHAWANHSIPGFEEAEYVRVGAAARDVLAERQRQVTAEGWTPAHDDKQTSGALAVCAACYALLAAADGADDLDFEWRQEYRKIVDRIWPYDREWLKPHVPRRMLEKSSAMTIAEMERIDRAAAAASGGDQV